MKPILKATGYFMILLAMLAIVVGFGWIVSWSSDYIGGWAYVIMGIIIGGAIWTGIYISVK